MSVEPKQAHYVRFFVMQPTLLQVGITMQVAEQHVTTLHLLQPCRHVHDLFTLCIRCASDFCTSKAGDAAGAKLFEAAALQHGHSWAAEGCSANAKASHHLALLITDSHVFHTVDLTVFVRQAKYRM